MYHVSSPVISFFQPRFSFHFLPVYFSPIHNTTVPPTIHNLLIFCVLFRLSISSMQCTNTYLHICAQNHSRQNPQFVIAYVSNTCSISTSWYRPLPSPCLSHVLFSQLLWRAGPPIGGLSAAPPDRCHLIQTAPNATTGSRCPFILMMPPSSVRDCRCNSLSCHMHPKVLSYASYY